MNLIKIIVPVFLLSILGGCDKENVDHDPEAEDSLIRSYIADNNLDAEKTDEGLYYIITRDGAGDRPNIGSNVTVHYKGYLLNGDIFDSSYDRGERSSFGLSRVIEGWQIGIPKFKEGGAGTLIIPSNLAYGSNPPSGNVIGVNEILVFDIELFEVN